MNKNALIAGVVILVLLLGAGIYMVFGKKNPTSTSTTTPKSANSTAPLSFSDMFAKAMSGGTSIKCTFESENATGISYIKNGNVRLDSSITSTKKQQTHTIMKNKIVWTWVEGATTGMMMDTTAMQAQITGGATPPVANAEDIQKEIETNKPNCTQENVSDSLFDVPTTIKFTDYTKMMNDLKAKIPANVTIPAGYKVPGM